MQVSDYFTPSSGGVTLPRSGAEVVPAVERILMATQPTARERRSAARLDRILSHASAREVLMGLTDEVLRIHDARHALRRLRSILDADLTGFGLVDRLGLLAASLAGRVAPSLVKRVVDWRIVAETQGVIFPSDRPVECGGFPPNLNLLGEAILGDGEAEQRVAELVRRLRAPLPDGADYVSVKISALCANLDVLAFEHSVARIADCLRTLYRAAMASSPHRFVNLDMEEYRDLALTLAAFTRVLDEPEFLMFEGGIVLQAYLPDSHMALRQLAEWSCARRDRGGAGIKVRIVKGANLAMESVEAELQGWQVAPYGSKVESDANLKRLVTVALDPKHRGALRIGLGSHNLFDIAWVAERATATEQIDRVEFEMLAGMAPAQARVVRELIGTVRLYTPVVERSALDAGISYLARRLDENAAPENFLRNVLRIAPGNEAFESELHRFTGAIAAMTSVSSEPRRTQHRSAEMSGIAMAHSRFINTPDTDFTSAANRDWITQHLARRPDVPVEVLTTASEADAVVATATAALVPDLDTRVQWLYSLAHVMQVERGESISLMAHDAGKTVREADPEVSEAIDAANWAAIAGASLLRELASDGLEVQPVGTVVVAAPWNFPYAIPALSLASAVVAGNRVIVKPSPHARAVGVHLVAQCHRAGIPADVVQVAACDDAVAGTRLVTHPDVHSVVLTGSTATAARLLDRHPTLRLVAETSGKNTMVVSEAADVDAAIRDVVRSAFGHAGQKCSAASLMVLVGDLAHRADVLERLADAVRSVRVGSALDVATMMGPLVGAANERLTRAFTTLEPGETWLVEPTLLDAEQHLWSPGVRIGVQPDSWFHRTECFGPVLGVMTADTLDEALHIQNSTGFGLTAGFHSLDPAEVQHWLRHVEAGNLYVNRHMTGAIVQRQPFGGWKQSSVGGGSKPGGPDHVLGFVRVAGELGAEDSEHTMQRAWNTLYGVDTDSAALSAEHNVLRHRPLDGVVVHLGDRDVLPASLARAAQLAGTPLWVSHSDIDTRALLEQHRPERLRVLAPVADDVLRVAHVNNIAVDHTPVTAHGRVELGRWLKEQSVSVTAHRHGRLNDTMAAPLRASRSGAPIHRK